MRSTLLAQTLGRHESCQHHTSSPLVTGSSCWLHVPILHVEEWNGMEPDESFAPGSGFGGVSPVLGSLRTKIRAGLLSYGKQLATHLWDGGYDWTASQATATSALQSSRLPPLHSSCTLSRFGCVAYVSRGAGLIVDTVVLTLCSMPRYAVLTYDGNSIF